MSVHVALFTDKAERHLADTCEPLLAATRRGDVRLQALVRGAYPGRPMSHRMLSGVCSVGFWDAMQPQPWGLDWHRNEGLEITFLERGSLSFGIGSETVELTPGTLTVTRPWQPHRVGNPHVAPSRLHWLIIDLGVRRPNQPWRWPPWLMLAPDDLQRLTELLRHNEHAVWPTDQETRECWQRIGRAVEEDVDGSSHSRLRVHVNELLLLLAETVERRKPHLDPSLTSAERTVGLFLAELRRNESQRSHPWTVSTMANRCGLGVTHFVQLCHQLTNRTPARYLTWCRIEAARELLVRQPPVPITEVALACGFSSGQYFATVFRREVGNSPAAFRNQGRVATRREDSAP